MIRSRTRHKSLCQVGLVLSLLYGCFCCTNFAFGKVVVPKAVYSQDVAAMATNVKSKTNHRSGTVVVSESDVNGTATATSAITIGGPPSLMASVSASSIGYASGGSVNQMVYYFQITGPKPIAVPVIVTGQGNLIGADNVNGVSASLSVSPNTGSEAGFNYQCSLNQAMQCGNYTTHLNLTITASTRSIKAAANLISAQTGAAVAVPDGSITAISSSASVGIQIAIDPTFAHANQYSIVVSRNVGN